MDPINNLPDPSAKPSGLAANLLASLTASFGSKSATAGLFADLLSQTPSSPPQPAANAQASSSPSSQQASQQDAGSHESNDKTNANQPAITPHASPHGGFAEKSLHRSTGQGADKGKSKNRTDDQVTSAPPPVATPDSVSAANTNPVAPVAVATDNPVANDPAAVENSVDTAPALDPVADINQQAVAAPVSTLPVTDISSLPITNNSDDTPTDNNAAQPQPLLTLMQLEHMAASRLAALASDENSVNAGTQNTNSAAGLTAPAAASAMQGKLDLKTLLTELAGKNNADVTSDNIVGQISSSVANSDVSNSATVAATAASAQNIAPDSNKTPPSTTMGDKWMNASFLNLFNLPAGNQGQPGIPFALGAATAAGLTLTGSDDAALNSDMQGQSGANTHGGSTGAPALDNNLMPTGATSQAARPYDFASQLSALRAAKGGPTGLPTPVEQVILQLSRGLSKDGSSQMTIQLRPAELGRVDVKLHIDSDGKVQGTVTADNPATLGLLIKDARSLERSLQEAGLRTDPGSLQFNLRGDGQAGGSFGQTSQNQSGPPNDAGSSSGSTLQIGAAEPLETYYLTPGGVNFRV